MFVTVITPPLPIISWAEADAHLKLSDDTSQKPYVDGLIAAATTWVDGPTGWLGRTLGEQVLEVRVCAFGGDCIVLPFGPVIDVESMKYLDADGAEQTVPADSYQILSDGRVALKSGQSWPNVADDPEAVRIRYTAGYAYVPEVPADGDTPAVPGYSTVPMPIKIAILLLIGHWYKSRETVVVGTISSTLPFAVDALLSTYRRLR